MELGIRLDTTYALIWAGKLSAERVDGAWRIPTGAVRKRLEQRTRKAVNEHTGQ